MKKYIFITIALILFPMLAYGETYWGGEVPVISDTAVEAAVTQDGDIYTYSYSIHSGFGNTGNVRRFHIDITIPRGGMELSGEGLPSRHLIGDERKGKTVPVGMFSPEGWWPGVSFQLRATWGGHPVPAGQSISGLKITSRGLPGIRNFWVQPELAITPYEITVAESFAFADKVSFKGKTIGPTAPPADSSGDFNPRALLEIIIGYIDESITLGWLTNATLADNLRAKLGVTRQALDAADGIQAKAALAEFMAMLDSSSASQRTSEGYGLLYYNAQYLENHLPDYLQDAWLLELFPENTTLSVGEDIRFTARLTKNGEPQEGYPLPIYYLPLDVYHTYTDSELSECGELWFIGSTEGWLLWTDSNGEKTFDITYESFDERERLRGMGDNAKKTFIVNVKTWFNPSSVVVVCSNPVEVIWSGGPDLVVESLFPPVVKIKAGEQKQIAVKEVTKNIGTTTATPSVTRYYLSLDEVIDLGYDRILGERQIPALEPGESSDEGSVQVILQPGDMRHPPSSDPPADNDMYYLIACVDAGKDVAETSELNNCLQNQVATQIVMLVEPNQPPDCSQAFPAIASLWPPDHKTVRTGIVGVTDPDGDDIALKITGITQDEPVNGLGDGDTAPDGFGVGSSKAELRAERSGTGNGRVYAIHFAADDGNGGQCNGSVNVVVPHDKRKGSAAIDDGQAYNSTRP